MTAEQLVQELKDTVLELHFARRHAEALAAENAALRAKLAPEEEHGHSHPHDEDADHTHDS
ncbi:hypothetical protein PO587_02880 [Streptomyces gilvifuscus]|uniref:Uncharacterized protein n=1 Tax=Streptomyces gilvifuscus TaxID=1550617 RepID=A0ABT5FLK7_9ACTN|nr:hypothetical protein [Streptomyces gilvifuscus]MDC2953396.1 hypothetical protein [Streptomyces gilvifuscus]